MKKYIIFFAITLSTINGFSKELPADCKLASEPVASYLKLDEQGSTLSGNNNKKIQTLIAKDFEWGSDQWFVVQFPSAIDSCKKVDDSTFNFVVSSTILAKSTYVLPDGTHDLSTFTFLKKPEVMLRTFKVIREGSTWKIREWDAAAFTSAKDALTEFQKLTARSCERMTKNRPDCEKIKSDTLSKLKAL